jgi:hypothetical protein
MAFMSDESVALQAPIYERRARNDCDSEGDEPPPCAFVDPLTVDDSAAPPPRNNEVVVLPFFRARERRRHRESYESKVGFEDWMDDGGTGAGGGGRQKITGVQKLEDDSDFPVGSLYFWKGFCPVCSKTYHPHIPGMWTCLQCKAKVHQQPDDPESKRCAECRRDVARIVQVRNRKLRNPMLLNSHVCKRCGRVVCDHCYSPSAVALEEFGYVAPQLVCTRCVSDIALRASRPEAVDLGTLYVEEVVGDHADVAQCNPFWVPKCTRCNITYAAPPDRWMCPSCLQPVWQPADVPESQLCWLCPNQLPKVRCHQCGQRVCDSCGAYGQPLPAMGWLDGHCLTVCRACYRGTSLWAKESQPKAMEAWRPSCGKCHGGGAGGEWNSSCHKVKAWQPSEHASSKECAVCASAIQKATSDNCRRCGRLVCLPCAQYREPVPDRGFSKEKGEPVCRGCFNVNAALTSDTSDHAKWPARCGKCRSSWPTPPDRWRCPNQCGTVWQMPEHIASKACWTCGKKLAAGAVNCRKCGRIVCPPCGEGKAEVPELGFTRGVKYPVCGKCLKPPEE